MYAALAEETFAPVINRTSKHIAESLDPIYERQQTEQQRRQDRLAQLKADVEEERRREETFAPKTATLPPGMSMEHRLPLADRSNAAYMRSGKVGHEPAALDPTPAINARSADLVSHGAARAHVDEANRIRKQIQTLWVAHSDGANTMRRAGALGCLHDLGVTSGSTTEKFLLALGFVQGPHIAREEHVLHVDYDRFGKVLTAVLRAASAATAAMEAAKPNDESRQATSVDKRGSAIVADPPPRRSHSRQASAHRPNIAASDKSSHQEDTHGSTAKPTTYRCAAGKPVHVPNKSATAVGRSMSQPPATPASRRTTPNRSGPATTSSSRPSRSPSSATTTQEAVQHRRALAHAPALVQRSDRARHERSATAALDREGDDSPRPDFTPRINHSAVPENRGAVSRPAMRDETRDRLNALKAARAERELEACTFQPKILRTRRGPTSAPQIARERKKSQSHSPSPQAPRSQARTVSIGSEDDDDDDELFDDDNDRTSKQQPSRRTSRSSSAAASTVDSTAIASTMLGVTPGFESAVRRMQRARKHRRPPFEESLRGGRLAYATDVAPPVPSRHTDPSVSPSRSVEHAPMTTEVSPFHLRTDARNAERELSKPLLYVDVDLPHGKTARIGVHRGDTAHELSRNFCVSYSLDDDTMYRLTDILQAKIDSVVQERTRTLWV